MMYRYEWAVIDPRYDRPFFSSSPPPDTLVRTPGMSVIRYEYPVSEADPNDVIVPVCGPDDARRHAQKLFNATRA